MIDAVIDDVAELLGAIEDRDLILAEEIPPLVYVAVADSVNPFDLLSSDTGLRRLCERRARGQ